MPIYEYSCTKCGYIFEKIEPNINKITSISVECPNCKKIAKKIISKSSFLLKGGGWYKDGYSKEK